MQTRRFTRLPGMTLAIMLTLLVGQGLVFGDDDGDRTKPIKLEGTWDVYLQCPKETCDRTDCRCPGCPDNAILTLNTFLKGGGMVWSGGNLRAGTGQGAWERIGRHQFEARFKFLIFDLASGNRTGSEVLTKDISLTSPDRFEATTTYDLYDAAGSPTAEGCIINETGERFE
jgi:hypothetical protein